MRKIIKYGKNLIRVLSMVLIFSIYTVVPVKAVEDNYSFDTA